MNLKEAKVIITGATSGIGKETARVLKDAGAQVVICGRSQEKVEKVRAELGVIGITADVVKEQDVQELIEMGCKAMDGFNVLINNAGIGGGFTELTDTTTEAFEEVWKINTRGLFVAGREAAIYFKEQSYGNIINIGSTAALKGFARGSSYVASKFAVSGLTECWRAELRPHNVRVMQVNPSEVITEFFEKLGMDQKEAVNKLRPAQIAHLIKSMLTMDDVGFIPDASVWATNPW